MKGVAWFLPLSLALASASGAGLLVSLLFKYIFPVIILVLLFLFAVIVLYIIFVLLLLIVGIVLNAIWTIRARGKKAYYKKALMAYDEALRSNSSDTTAYRGKGNALAVLGRYDEALQAFEQAIALTPQSATYLSKGNVLAKLKRYDESLTAYEQAIELDPIYASAYAEMSETFEHLGRKQEAQRIREKAKQLGYEE